MSGGTEKGESAFRYLLPNAVIPLAVGLLLYVLFCPETYVTRFVSRFLPGVNAGNAVVPLPESAAFTALRNYGFDFLWAYALVSALCLITGTEKRQIALAAAVTALFGICSEAAQFFGWVPGTGDAADAIIEISAALIGAFTIYFFSRRKEKDNEKQ